MGHLIRAWSCIHLCRFWWAWVHVLRYTSTWLSWWLRGAGPSLACRTTCRSLRASRGRFAKGFRIHATSLPLRVRRRLGSVRRCWGRQPSFGSCEVVDEWEGECEHDRNAVLDDVVVRVCVVHWSPWLWVVRPCFRAWPVQFHNAFPHWRTSLLRGSLAWCDVRSPTWCCVVWWTE